MRSITVFSTISAALLASRRCRRGRWAAREAPLPSRRPTTPGWGPLRVLSAFVDLPVIGR